MSLSIDFCRLVAGLGGRARVVNHPKNVSYIACDITGQNGKRIAQRGVNNEEKERNMRTAFMVGILLSLVALATTSASAQPPVPPPTTAVLVNLTVKPDADRAHIAKIMPDEVRETAKLYLDGKIQQWYARSDGRGVMFILNVTDTAAAKALMDGLPLSTANLANYEYIALGPLTPLRYLLPQAPTAKEDR